MSSRAVTAMLAMCVAATAIALRLTFAPLLPPIVDPDGVEYVLPAWKLLHGEGLDLGLGRTGYPLFIAAVFGLLGEDLTSIVVVQHAVGVVNAVLAFFLGRRLLGMVGGLLVGISTALSGPLLLYEHFILAETLATTMVLASTLMLTQLLDVGSPKWPLATGWSSGWARCVDPLSPSCWSSRS